MTYEARRWGFVVLTVAILGVLLFIPYESVVVPEWRIRVADENGQPVAGVDVHQEWTHPLMDGHIAHFVETSDRDGWVSFPRRNIRGGIAIRVLAYALSRREAGPSAHAFVCWNDKTGDVFWDDSHRELDHRLPLRVGSCPYG